MRYKAVGATRWVALVCLGWHVFPGLYLSQAGGLCHLLMGAERDYFPLTLSLFGGEGIKEGTRSLRNAIVVILSEAKDLVFP